MGEICVVVEHRKEEVREITFQMLWKAHELCQALSHELTAVVISGGEDGFYQDLSERADRVIAYEGEAGKHFDGEFAKELSVFVTGSLYSRERIPHKTRQLVTVAALTVLERTEELKMHLHAALNVGCDAEELAEVIFQMATYGGVPVVNTALRALKDVLGSRDGK